MQYTAALDCLNFFLADVRGGLGPYVGVFLLTEAHWDQATLGAVLTVSGLLGITLHTPIGAFIDSTNAKRGLIILGVLMLVGRLDAGGERRGDRACSGLAGRT